MPDKGTPTNYENPAMESSEPQAELGVQLDTVDQVESGIGATMLSETTSGIVYFDGIEPIQYVSPLRVRTVANTGSPIESTQSQKNRGGATSFNSIAQYLRQIGRTPLLTAEEEVILAQTMERGAEVLKLAQMSPEVRLTAKDRAELRIAAEARKRFLLANLRLVISIARRYPLPLTMELLDLSQDGFFGLVNAVDNFDWRLGNKFSSFANLEIRQRIRRGKARRGSLIHLPTDRVIELESMLAQVNGVETELDEKAQEEIRNLYPIYLDQPVTEDGNVKFGDVLPDTVDVSTAAIDNVLHENIRNFLVNTDLSELDKFIIYHRFGFINGIEFTFEAIGKMVGLSAQAVSQRLKKSLALLAENDELSKLYKPNE